MIIRPQESGSIECLTPVLSDCTSCLSGSIMWSWVDSEEPSTSVEIIYEDLTPGCSYVIVLVDNEEEFHFVPFNPSESSGTTIITISRPILGVVLETAQAGPGLRTSCLAKSGSATLCGFSAYWANHSGPMETWPGFGRKWRYRRHTGTIVSTTYEPGSCSGFCAQRHTESISGTTTTDCTGAFVTTGTRVIQIDGALGYVLSCSDVGTPSSSPWPGVGWGGDTGPCTSSIVSTSHEPDILTRGVFGCDNCLPATIGFFDYSQIATGSIVDYLEEEEFVWNHVTSPVYSFSCCSSYGAISSQIEASTIPIVFTGLVVARVYVVLFNLTVGNSYQVEASFTDAPNEVVSLVATSSHALVVIDVKPTQSGNCLSNIVLT